MNLKEFRKMNNLKEKEMADAIGVSSSFYYKVESGQQNPSYSFLVKLKRAFPEIVIDEIFFR